MLNKAEGTVLLFIKKMNTAKCNIISPLKRIE